jgi:hypothetical protein
LDFGIGDERDEQGWHWSRSVEEEYRSGVMIAGQTRQEEDDVGSPARWMKENSHAQIN